MFDSPLVQDADNSTILHMLASLPCPLTPTHIKVPEAHRAAVRMSNLYFDECGWAPEPALPSRSAEQELTLAVPYLIDWSNASGKTALHVAAQSGNVELVRVRVDGRLR